MHPRFRLAKNALSNLVRGGSTTAVNLCLPAILVRHLSFSDYAIWVLTLQIAAYCVYLELGFQTAVGRYIAVAVEKSDFDEANAIYSTALGGLMCTAALAIFALIGVACAAGRMFPSIPAGSLTSMRVALLIVGSSVALGLPSFAWTGAFVGLERNELIAFVSGGAKLLLGLGVAIAAIHGASIVILAVVAGGVNLVSYWLLYLLARRVPFLVFRVQLINRRTARELFSYCYSLMIWNFSMLLINGLDLILVGRFQFSSLAPFAIASTVVGTIQGIQLAVFNATMPRAAVLHVRRETVALGRLVVRYTQLGMLLLLLVGMPLLIYTSPLLRVWVGPQYAAEGEVLLKVLVVANIVRLVATPYTVILVATGQQKLVTLSPMMEGFTNLAASLFLGLRYGALGVAAGTLVGAIVGLLGHVIYNLPRTGAEIELRARDFIGAGIGWPVLCTLPLILLTLCSTFRGEANIYLFSTALAATLVASGVLIRHTSGIS